jgi:hypothetical protein
MGGPLSFTRPPAAPVLGLGPVALAEARVRWTLSDSGKVVETWAQMDIPKMMMQLGAMPGPGGE